jgi:hypothetical protein
MNKYEKQELIKKHGNYRYIFMNEIQLRAELKNWCRQDLINWLTWNDPNGIYNDNQSLKEIGNILTYEEGQEIMIKQIIQKNA